MLPRAEQAGDGGGELAGDAERPELQPLLELALVELLHGRPHTLYLPPSPEVSRVWDAGGAEDGGRCWGGPIHRLKAMDL